MSLTLPTVASSGYATATWLVSTCQAGLTNQWYRVVTSTTHIDSGWGPALTTNLAAPTINPSFDHAQKLVGVGERVYFTDTSTSNGSPIAAWAWDFGDGDTGGGAANSHVYNTVGTYTVTLRVTDTCGYLASVVLTDAVEVWTALADIAVSPLALNALLNPDNSTVRTLTISNIGTADLDWSLTEAPTATWLSEAPGSGTVASAGGTNVAVSFDATGLSTGTYTSTLQVISNDPDEPQVDVAATLLVTTACIPVSGAHIAYARAAQMGQVVHFTGTVQSGSLPLSYTWDFGDGETGMGSTVVHAYAATVALAFTVRMTATSSCDGSFDTDEIKLPITPGEFYLYLPVVLKTY